jgi:GTP-binding protein
MPIPTIAIVGRPNVGKSTLFNRVLGSRVAVVDDMPGVTRDRHYAQAEWAGREFYLVDTGGYIPEGRSASTIASVIRGQAETAIAESDVVVLVTDVETGVDDADRQIATLLAKRNVPAVVAVNKVDNEAREVEVHEAWALGLGQPHGVSAVSGRGSGDLLDAVIALLPPEETISEEDVDEIGVAVIGRPNVGKSSLVNILAGDERVVVDPVAGTTRDAVDTVVEHEGARFRLIDTAGLRRKPMYGNDLEFYSGLRSVRAIRRADVAVLVVDASEGLTVGDVKVGQLAFDAGRGLIVAANKWDIVEKDHRTFDENVKRWRGEAKLLDFVPILSISALTGLRAQRLFGEILRVRHNLGRRIQTAELNRTVGEDMRLKPPPARRGAHINIKYVTQTDVDPPRFSLFANHPDLIDDLYMRFVVNRIREHHDFTGAPVVVKAVGSKKREKRK